MCKFCSSIFKSNGAIPTGPNVALLAVFTFNSFLIRLISSAIILNTFCKKNEQLAPVSNRAVIGSVLRTFNAKFDNFNLHPLNLI